MIRVTASSSKKLHGEMELLSKIRECLKKDQIAIRICKEKGFKEEVLEAVPIAFDDMEPSAKTIDSYIYLNRKLKKLPFNVLMRYVIHELTHCVQHMLGTNGSNSKKYLDREHEIEAFQNQLEFDATNRGEGKAEEYVEDLLDFHKIKGKERGSKKNELLEQV